MKYIVLRVKNGDIEREFPVIFPEEFVHSDVAEQLSHCLVMKDVADESEAVSAGFISSIQLGYGIDCHGKSETLKLKSRGQADNDLISMLDYTHGIVL